MHVYSFPSFSHVTQNASAPRNLDFVIPIAGDGAPWQQELAHATVDDNLVPSFGCNQPGAGIWVPRQLGTSVKTVCLPPLGPSTRKSEAPSASRSTVRLSTVLWDKDLRSRSVATSRTIPRKKSLSPWVRSWSLLVERLGAGAHWGRRILDSINSDSMLIELGGRESLGSTLRQTYFLMSLREDLLLEDVPGCSLLVQAPSTSWVRNTLLLLHRAKSWRRHLLEFERLYETTQSSGKVGAKEIRRHTVPTLGAELSGRDTHSRYKNITLLPCYLVLMAITSIGLSCESSSKEDNKNKCHHSDSEKTQKQGHSKETGDHQKHKDTDPSALYEYYYRPTPLLHKQACYYPNLVSYIPRRSSSWYQEPQYFQKYVWKEGEQGFKGVGDEFFRSQPCEMEQGVGVLQAPRLILREGIKPRSTQIRAGGARKSNFQKDFNSCSLLQCDIFGFSHLYFTEVSLKLREDRTPDHFRLSPPHYLP
uniref:Uncharacterized protein n=1 Tax=Timema shepardi TaxID=629360 RepID=A0A7R9AZU1_TIMSH|nr:unnamed protein product [Timema shepardi]